MDHTRPAEPIDRGGDERLGLTLFAGGLRWFGMRWGFSTLPKGLRRAGFAGKVVYWPWHGRWTGLPWPSVPALCDSPLHQRQAQAMADYLADYRRRYPQAPLYVMGCSAGGWIAWRVLELLPPEVTVDGVALLSAAVDPGRDLTAGLAHVRGVVVNTFSYLDCLILGLGTLVVGTGDRRHTPACGMVGLKGNDGRVVNLPWRPGMIFSGKLGGHVTATPPAFIARYVAPLLGIGTGGA